MTCMTCMNTSEKCNKDKCLNRKYPVKPLFLHFIEHEIKLNTQVKLAISLSKPSVSCRKLVAAKKHTGQDVNFFLSLTFEELSHELTTVKQTCPGYSIVTYCIIIIVTTKL